MLVTKSDVELRMLLGPDRIENWERMQGGDDPIPQYFERAIVSAPTDGSTSLKRKRSEGGGGIAGSSSMGGDIEDDGGGEGDGAA